MKQSNTVLTKAQRLFLPLTILLMLLQWCAIAQPVYDCRRTTQAPTIDGRLNDKAWKEANTIDKLVDIRGGETPQPRQQTTIKMLYDDQFLYVGATLQEDYLRARIGRHDDIVWQDNDFEVFLNPYCDGKMYYELEVNALGTLLDLLMDRPYSEAGTCYISWNCQDLRYAVHCDGTLNDSSNTDQGWSVEMAIPFVALQKSYDHPLRHKVWRMNFSRVEWPTDQGPEENWVWAPTGVIDIHRPAKWGYVRFVEEGETPTPIHQRYVKNWVWESPHRDWTDERYQQHFAKLVDCGISAVLFEGYDERVYRLCHEAGLQAHYWNWTLNRGEQVESHPDWYAVSRQGKSCANEPPYVNYYHFLCPSHQEVVDYLVDDFERKSRLPYVDGMHLDYIRFPDVVLPVDLWKNYGVVQTAELPEFDFCYCDSCRHHYRQRYGVDPLQIAYPMASPSWISYRYEVITKLVQAIHQQMASHQTFLSAAVFPTPDMARKMVRQDWDHWGLDAYFPMIYNSFYRENIAWIGQAVKECVQAIPDHAQLYAGLMFPDIKGELFEQALDAAFSNGASGIAFFAEPDDEHLDRFKVYLKKHALVPNANGF